MSFLSVSAVEDDSATLRELLAAVDAWDPRSPTSLACAVDKIAAPFIEDEPTTAVHRTHATSIGKPAKKRTRNPEEDVRRRLRRKAERESLRQHVRDLQVKLARLLEVRRTGLAPTGEPMVIPPATTLIGHSSVRTHSDAAMSDDQRELADARTINQELKARIAQNEVLMRALNDSITVSAACLPHHWTERSNLRCAFVIFVTKGTFLFTCRLTMASGVDVSPLRQMYANVKRIKTKIPPFGPESMLCTSNISVGLDGSPRVEVMAGVHLNRDVRGAAGVIAAYFKELCPFGRSVQHCIEVRWWMLYPLQQNSHANTDFTCDNVHRFRPTATLSSKDTRWMCRSAKQRRSCPLALCRSTSGATAWCSCGPPTSSTQPDN